VQCLLLDSASPEYFFCYFDALTARRIQSGCPAYHPMVLRMRAGCFEAFLD